MSASLYTWRKVKHGVALSLSIVAALFGLMWLVWILWTTITKGMGSLNLDLFTQMTPPPNEPGGLANALFGSVVMSLLAILLGTPIGVAAGTYLAEYANKHWLGETVRFVNDILLSAPSIVLGLFVYAILVAPMGQFSGFAGSLALSLIAIPVVVRTTENMLRLVPGSLREAAAALGAPRWKVALMITLRAAKSGVITGLLLAIARVSGETAPLLFTALNNQFFSANMNEPMANLPVVIFQFAMSPYDNWNRLAWGGALLITLTVLLINIVARVFFRDKKAGH